VTVVAGEGRRRPKGSKQSKENRAGQRQRDMVRVRGDVEGQGTTGAVESVTAVVPGGQNEATLG